MRAQSMSAGLPVASTLPAFVGRRRELDWLSRLLDESRAGQARLALVEGPPGIGKTTLVHQFLSLADKRRVLRASGEQGETNLPFAVLSGLMRATQTAESPAPPFDALKGDNGAADPVVAGAALVDLLGELQNAGVVVLVLDDLHWADRPSQQAVTFALRRMNTDQVLAIVITRDVNDPGVTEGIRRLLADEHAARLYLDGLNAGELRRLSARLRFAPLSWSAATRLYWHTNGNPLHARALLEHVPSAAFDNPAVPLPVPPSVASLVLARLAQCYSHAQELVGAASILGTRCALHVAADLAELKDPLPALENAIEAGLLVEEPATGHIRFPHPLVHATISLQLGPARRTALHRRAASLVDDGRSRLHHRAAAATGPDAVLANDFALLGRRAACTGSWEVAADHLSTAARLAPTSPTRERLTLEAFECQLLTGEVTDPDEVLVQLRGLPTSAWQSYVRARIELVAGRFAEADSLLRDAWQRCGAVGEPAIAARIAAQTALLYLLRGCGQEASQWAGEALRLEPQHAGTDMLECVRLASYGVSGRAAAMLALLDDLPNPAVASPRELDVLLGRGLLRLWTDDLTGALHDLGGVLGASSDRSVGFRLVAANCLVMVEYRLGGWDHAAAHNQLASSIASDANQTWLAPLCHANAALISAARGQWEQALSHTDIARAGAAASGNILARGYAAATAAQVARARGKPDDVISVLDPLVQARHCEGLSEPAMIGWQDVLVEALVAVGNLSRAEKVLRPFEARASDLCRHSAMAAAARARGTLTAAHGNFGGAVQAFQTSLGHASKVDMPFELAMVHLGYGIFLRRNGKRGWAGSELETAQEIFGRLGARPYGERCERELAACGRSPTRRSASDRTALTPQELAVARLVAQGGTNRQVARELMLSVKTIEYHLGHVYAKLQISSREELAQRLVK